MPHSLGFEMAALDGVRSGLAARAGIKRADRGADARARLRRELARDLHSRDSHRVMSGLIGLLALCEQASKKRSSPQTSIAAIHQKMAQADRRPREALRAFGARPLHCAHAPGLYAILAGICARAGLRRAPELFLLPCSGMNAYALGGPGNACITVTDGLLRGLSPDEVGGIFAHEVAHVLHHDAGAMSWAAAVQKEIAELALRGIGDLTARGADFASIGAQALFLAAAPAMARLLISALSRTRELAADARAAELIEHPKALVAALCKLEHFHSGLAPARAAWRDDPLERILRSHPETWERIALLT